MAVTYLPFSFTILFFKIYFVAISLTAPNTKLLLALAFSAELPCEMSHSVIASTALSSQGHHYCLPRRSANLPEALKVVSQPYVSVTSSLQATVSLTLDMNSDQQIHPLKHR